ncbi:hypothetical protein RRG08_013869 [Elysia crispata]|uniref:Uncharacterized protein n=1 Tax=Elysia crispata TaxID=231223 RepID=A0AAE1D1D1_9GAST|nr:hypothetical protein RRG08_013869 [Elysia crispata]
MGAKPEAAYLITVFAINQRFWLPPRVLWERRLSPWQAPRPLGKPGKNKTDGLEPVTLRPADKTRSPPEQPVYSPMRQVLVFTGVWFGVGGPNHPPEHLTWKIC